MLERIEQILSDMKPEEKSKAERAGLLLPILQRIQREFGYIPEEVIPRVARGIGVPDSHVYGVATFYAHFKFRPRGKHHITVCCGTACHVRGSSALLEDIQDTLQIKPGETTPDMQFSLETTACFGSCALAPVVVVDENVQGRMNRNRMISVIDTLEGSASEAPDGAKETAQ